jgi:transposase
LLADLCRTIKEAPQAAGRPGPKPFSMADIIFSATFKVYSTFSGRRFMVDLEEANEKGRTTRLLHYNSIFRYLENPTLTPILRDLVSRSALPLKSVETGFAVDSSGFSTSTFVKWFDFKHGTDRRVRAWIKTHLMVGVKTHVVTSVEIDQTNQSDYNQFAPLVSTTAESFTIKDVTADKAYLGHSNLNMIDALGGTMYAPFKSNSTAGEPGTVWNKMFAFWQFHRDTFMERYHSRSNIESVFSMMKRKHGNAIRSKTPTAQVNEVLCKVLTHNICVLCQEIQELGIAVNFGANMEAD